MKKLYIIAGLLFLASCGRTEVQENPVTDIPATPETIVEEVLEEIIETAEEQPQDNTSSTEVELEDIEAQEAVKPEIIVEPSADDVDESLLEEIDDEVAVLETAVEDTTKTVVLDAPYNNPKGLVDMKLSYTLDSEGKIATIGVSATTYQGLGDFNDAIQSLVGSTLEEASEYKSGSSLTAPAFISAIKSQL